MKFQWTLRAIERELRERERSRRDALSTTHETGKERIYYKFHIL